MKTLYGVGGILFALILLALIFWFYKRGASGVAKDTASASVEAIGGLVVGAVEGASKTVGIPNTDPDKCAAAQTEGRWWDASFDCAAPLFFKGAFNRVFSNEPLIGTTQ